MNDSTTTRWRRGRDKGGAKLERRIDRRAPVDGAASDAGVMAAVEAEGGAGVEAILAATGAARSTGRVDLIRRK